MNKQNVVCKFNEVLLSHKKEQSTNATQTLKTCLTKEVATRITKSMKAGWWVEDIGLREE